MTAALDFRDRVDDGEAFEPRVEIRRVALPGWLGKGPLKMLHGTGLMHDQPGPGDPFVVVITPSGETFEHTRRAEETAYQTAKALTASGMTTFQYGGNRPAIMVYCFPIAVDPHQLAAESLKRMWAQLWK